MSMTHDDALIQWHQQTLNGFLKEIDHLMHHPAKYLDPDLSREPSTGKSLYERAEIERRQVVKDFPALGAADVPAMHYRFPTGLGESLDREELKRLRGDVQTLLHYVRPGRN